MSKVYFVLALLCVQFTSQAQTDTTAKPGDTIRVGNIIILKKGGTTYESDKNKYSPEVKHYHRRKVSTNWVILDLGFSNYSDKTIYGTSAVNQISPNATEGRFDLRNSKSVNVNLWLFMQRVSLIKRVVNLKYGAGIELNNYRYEAPVYYSKTPSLRIHDTTLHFSKNKLAADYVTVPVMLNFNFTPNRDHNRSFGFSVGASAGFLYSSRQKYVSSETGKQKIKGDLGMEDFKISYIAELHLGPVRFYGSLAKESMFKKGLDQKPYNIGIRFSNW